MQSKANLNTIGSQLA